MAVVAAQTERIRVAPNVANLPLRGPLLIAKSVASLDILSGGRAELGLGAGALWDRIAAVGGPRRTPGESVSALSEAIDVIRALWTTGDEPLHIEGEHYAWPAPTAAPRPRTLSRSGWAPTSRGCCA